MFARDGFDSVTVEQITEAADVSAMTFYRHFGSKEAVVTSVATTDQMNHAIGALDRIRIPGEIQMFSMISSQTQHLGKRNWPSALP